MNAPNAEALLRVWEAQVTAPPIRRALALLDAAWPEVGIEVWGRAPIGTRDGCLLLLYETLFGPDLHAVTHCPSCDERLESTFSTRDFGAPPALPGSPNESLRLHEQGFDIEFRLPTSEDLLQLDVDDAGPASVQLLQRCLLDVHRDGARLAVDRLPVPIRVRLAEEMEQRDPHADIRVALACPACARKCETTFDIVSYLWDEIDDWAQRLMADIHVLASAYGWREADVLALAPRRRQLYVDMVRA